VNRERFIVSRADSAKNRIDRFLKKGAPLIWIVDPEDRTVAVHQPNELPKVLDESDTLTGNGVLPEFSCKVADLFRLPGQA
jgi:Uma2 family endonuclease